MKRVRNFLSKDSHVEIYKIMNGTKTGIFCGFFFFFTKHKRLLNEISKKKKRQCIFM